MISSVYLCQSSIKLDISTHSHKHAPHSMGFAPWNKVTAEREQTLHYSANNTRIHGFPAPCRTTFCEGGFPSMCVNRITGDLTLI